MPSRRTALAALGAAFGSGLSGCAVPGGDSDERQRTDRTATDGETTETVSPTATLTPTRNADETATAAPTHEPTPTPGPASTTGTPAFAVGRDDGSRPGERVALTGDIAVLAGEEVPAAVFERSDGEWEQTATLTSGFRDHTADHPSVAVAGDTVLVGGADAGEAVDQKWGPKGVVNCFQRADDGWVHRHTFESPAEEDYDWFGQSVAFDGERAVVSDVTPGGPEHSGVGTVYVFRGGGSDWTLEATIQTESADLLGHRVAVDGDTILAAAPYAGDEEGPVFAYDRVDGEWIRTATFGGRSAYEYGSDLALDGPWAATGNDRDDKVHVFERVGDLDTTRADDGSVDDWTFRSDLRSPGDHAYGFGEVLALDGDAIVVGDDREERAYVYRPDNRDADAVLAPESAGDDAGFGADVAVDDGTVLVGAPGAGGAAYLFEI